MKNRKPDPELAQTVHEMITRAAEDKDKDFPHREDFLRHSYRWYLDHPEFEMCEAFKRFVLQDFLNRTENN